jgi:hypothetical protein
LTSRRTYEVGAEEKILSGENLFRAGNEIDANLVEWDVQSVMVSGPAVGTEAKVN